MLGIMLLVSLASCRGQAVITDLRESGLPEFPAIEDIPSETTQLFLDINEITFIPAGSLCHTQLKELRITHNELTSVGNLTCVGSSLQKLLLQSNSLTRVRAQTFEGLDVLVTLDLSHNQLTEFPELWDVADTLTRLAIFQNPDMGGLPPTETFAQLTELNALHVYSIGEISFSPLIMYADQMTHLSFGDTQRFSLIDPEELSKFSKLQLLRLIQTNPIEFSHLSNSASTLKELRLNGVPLEELSRKDLHKLYALSRLSILKSNLKKIPCAASILERVALDGNQLTHLPRIASCTQMLNLKQNSVSRITGRHAATLKNLNWIILTLNPLEKLEDILDLEMNPSAIIDVSTTAALDLCKCEHVWLKIAQELGATVRVTDVQCGESLWSVLSSTQLMGRCDQSSLTEVNASSSTGWSIMRPKAASCELPVHAYYSSVLQVHCARHCFSRQGRCVAYKFRLTGGRYGSCQLLVPSVPADGVISVPDGGEAGWKCFTASPDIQ